MFGLGMGEILLVLALALIFIEPEKLTQVAQSLGRLGHRARRAVDELKENFFGD